MRGWAGGLPLLAGLALLMVCVQSGAAQQRKYLVELGAAGAYQSFDGATDLGGAAGGLGRLGVWLPLNFSVEVEGAFASPKTKSTDEGVSVKTFGVSALYNILIGNTSSFYLKAGAGSTKYGSSCPATATRGDPICGSSGALMGGAGFRVGVTPTVMVRAEGLYNRNKSKSRPSAPGVSLSNFGINVGVSMMLGSKPIPDADADGVLDNRDRCADTPAGASVDSRGCPSDSDGDGVPDGVDRCTTTVAGAAVDVRGCSQDTDGDNIPDGLDRCPDTPAGVLVDPRGCPKDSDGDKIPDGLDRCSETPRGATVDALGCPGDEDGDGVLDGLDRCPRTPAGASVNATGCVAGQAPGGPAPAAGQPQAGKPAAPPTGQQPALGQQPAKPGAPKPGAGQPPKVQPDTVGRPLPRPNVTVPSPTAPPAAPAKAPLNAGIIPGVGFVPGTARLLQSSYVALDSVALLLKASPDAQVEIGAHSDNSGTPADNLRLTALQAEAVRDYLVVKGVAYQQLVARGYGSTMPLTPNATPRAQAANRRVEIRPIQSGP
ncbi:MAG TPA: OmpA family protein [Gemmatimonadales bacterium]|nr:OmpA family protein [Gemmatimonadales bacterium]